MTISLYQIVLLTVTWSVTGFLSYGKTLAFFQRQFTLIAEEQRKSDQLCSFFFALFGPIGLVVAILLCYPHGFMWKLPPINN